MQTSNLAGSTTNPSLTPPVKLDRVAEFAARLGVSKPFVDLLSATRAIFAGPVWVEVDEDPEIPGRSYFVFHVIDAGSAENSSRRRKWYQVSEELIPEHIDKLCLTIDSAK